MLLRSRRHVHPLLAPIALSARERDAVAQVMRTTAAALEGLDPESYALYDGRPHGEGVGRKRTLLTKLTQRERDVIELVVRGATDREIARDLGISTNTVNEYVMSIKRKIGAANRVSIATQYYGDTPYWMPPKDS